MGVVYQISPRGGNVPTLAPFAAANIIRAIQKHKTKSVAKHYAFFNIFVK